MDEPLKGASITDFPGLASDRNPHVEPAVPVAVLNARLGSELKVRKGLLPVAFSNEDTDTAYSIISMFGLHGPEAEIVVYQDSNGSVKIGKNPS